MTIDRNKHNKYTTTTGYTSTSSETSTSTSTSSGSSSVSSSTTIIYDITEEQEAKLDSIEEGAQVNQNAFSTITISDGSITYDITATDPSDTVTFLGVSPIKLSLVDGVIQISCSTDTGVEYLYELEDVDTTTVTNPSNQDVLQYNSSSNKWVAASLSDYATLSWVTEQINLLVGSAPSVLDTIYEIAEALNNDPDYVKDIANNLSSLTNRVVSIEDMFEWDGNKIKAKAGLYSVGEITAYGYADDPTPSGVQYLSELKDVDLTNLADKCILLYNSTTGKWEATDGSDISPDLSSYATLAWVTAQLSSAINTGTSGRLAYYSSTDAISSYSSTVGGTTRPVYISSGVPTALSSTVGSATQPVYMSSGTITAGTYSFGNSSGNAAINNGTLNTNLNADMLDGVHNGSLTAAYTHNGSISANRVVTKNDNSGYPVYILIAECTDTVNASSNGTHYGFTGIIIESRTNGYVNEKVTKLTARVGYSMSNYSLTSDSSITVPYILRYGDTYYLAIRVSGSGHPVYFYGFAVNLLSTFIQVNTTDSSGTLPDGYSIAYSGSGISYHGNATSATQLATARTIWGQSFDGTADVTGAISGATTITASGRVSGGSFVAGSSTTYGNGYAELYHDTPFIDFHYNSSTADYTSRIIAGVDGQLTVVGNLTVGGTYTTDYGYKLYVGGTLYATGATTFNSTLAVTSTSTFTGRTTHNGGLSSTTGSFSSTLSVTGAATLSSTLSVSGAITGGSTIYAATGLYSDGYVSALGQNTSSDIRLKNIMEVVKLNTSVFAKAPLFRFSWKDREDMVEIGSSAQYFQRYLPDAVKERDGYLEMGYGNVALAGVITIAQSVKILEKRIKRLEKENARLKELLMQK